MVSSYTLRLKIDNSCKKSIMCLKSCLDVSFLVNYTNSWAISEADYESTLNGFIRKSLRMRMASEMVK